jgi:phosphatidylglycerol:prolipoprotein diacylglycerol transferase
MSVSYGLIMFAAIATGILISRYTQRQLALTRMQKLGLFLGALCGAMIGAKVPFVASDWSGLLSGAAWFANGKTILFGLIGGYFGVELAKWSLDIKIKTGDGFAAPVAASVAVGRLACFQAGCCYGSPTSLPWGVVFPSVDGIARHPTQIYEFVFHLSLAVILWILQVRGVLRGQLIKFYILCYVLYRFMSEFVRPEVKLWGDLTGYQWASILIFGLFVWLWIRDSTLRENEGEDDSGTQSLVGHG